MTKALNILVVEAELTVAEAICDALRRRGHTVAGASSIDEALERPMPEVLITNFVAGALNGIELLDTLRKRGKSPHAIFLCDGSVTERHSRAREMGVAWIIPKPVHLELLIEAVESHALQSQRDAKAEKDAGKALPESVGFVFEARYPTTPASVPACARDISAHALRADIGPTPRSRIGTAVSEIVDNVRKHAYAGSFGFVSVRATINEREFIVEISDEGCGFDVVHASLEHMNKDSTSGLARAASLAEDIQIKSDPDVGTRVTLRFCAYRVDFDESASIDLSEMDFFTPEISRRVLKAIRSVGGESMFQLSPALAVSVGRMLNGPDSKMVLQNTLWN